MTSLGEFCTAGTIKCNKIIATDADIPGGGSGGDIDISSINFDNKWKIYLDTNSDFIIKNEAQNVISLSGDAHTGKVTLRDFNLEDLANVDTIGLLSGDVMYYDGTNQKYKFTNTLNYAVSSWDLSNIPLNFTGSDLRIQSTNSNNIFIGGTNRTDSIINGGSVGIGIEAGDTSNNVYNVAIGYHAGKIKQGYGSALNGQCIAIGFNSGENNQDALAIALGGNSGQTDQSEGAIAVGNNAGNTEQGIHSIAIGVGAGFSRQDDNSVAIGLNAGSLNQDGNCIAIGPFAGQNNQDPDSIAIGNTAGQASQGQNSVAIGTLAGQIGQGTESIAIGDQAGKTSQGSQSIAMGHQSGETSQANEAIAIGHQAGKSTQLSNSICLGHQSGFSSLGRDSLAIGHKASFDGGSHDNTIVLNGTGSALNPQGTDRTYIKPIREQLNNEFLHYDSVLGEVTKSIAVNFTSNFLLNSQSGVSGEVLTSQGALTTPVWTTPASTTYTAGTDLSLVGTTFNNTAPDQIVSLAVVNTPNPGLTAGGTYPALTIGQPTKIMFHGVFNNKSQNCFVSYPNVCYATGFSDRFTALGGGWNPTTGRFTAPRNCYMNFCWQCMLYSFVGGGSNLMNAQITHFTSTGAVKDSVVNQFIPSFNDGQNQLQATPCVSAVVYMQAGEYVQAGASSDNHFRIYSINVNTQVSFSGHNCD